MPAPLSEETVSRVIALAAEGLTSYQMVARTAAEGAPMTRGSICGILARKGISFAKDLHAWSPEEDATVRAEFALWVPAAKIAEILLAKHGTRRSEKSVRDHAARIGCERQGRAPATVAFISTKQHATTRRSTKISASAAASVEAKPAAPEMRCVPLADIDFGRECRYPVATGPALMCGARVHAPGSAWCAFHKSIVYVPKAARKAEIRRYDAIAISAARGGKSAVPVGW